MMCRLYVASSASTRISDGSTRLTSRYHDSASSPASAREELLQAREEVAPERQRAADEVLPHAALRLVHAERDAACERAALERRVDLVLVEAVAELVHRPEQAAEVIREVARRDADVGRCRCPTQTGAPSGRAATRRRCSRTRLHDLELEHLLRLERVLARLGVVAAARRDLLDERSLVLLQVVEDAPDFLRRHVALVVVEDDVVRLVLYLEAVDVALAQIEVLPQDGQERLEVVRLARVDPHLVRERGGARHLGAQLRRHLARLLPVAGADADQARLERVVVLLLAPAAQVVEQPADLGRDELRVRDAPDRRHLLRPDRRALLGHHHVLVPAEESGGLDEIRDLGEALPQVVELGLAHAAKPI